VFGAQTLVAVKYSVDKACVHMYLAYKGVCQILTAKNVISLYG
jgi:hypothetical protein